MLYSGLSPHKRSLRAVFLSDAQDPRLNLLVAGIHIFIISGTKAFGNQDTSSISLSHDSYQATTNRKFFLILQLFHDETSPTEGIINLAHGGELPL